MSSSPSIMRAFTKRQKRPKVSAPMPVREGQVRFAPGTIDRSRISPAVELLSSTNILAYTAPDLPIKGSTGSSSSSSASSSVRSADDLDMPNYSPITSPSTSSRDGSPVSTEPSVGYFDKRAKPSARSSASSSQSKDGPPPIPQRALSHTKSHPNFPIATRMGLPPVSLNGALAEPTHPFGKELAQVNEAAEQFTRHIHEEEQELMHKGLKKFGVEDYIYEIQDLYETYFGNEATQVDQQDSMGASSWI